MLKYLFRVPSWKLPICSLIYYSQIIWRWYLSLSFLSTILWFLIITPLIPIIPPFAIFVLFIFLNTHGHIYFCLARAKSVTWFTTWSIRFHSSPKKCWKHFERKKNYWTYIWKIEYKDNKFNVNIKIENIYWKCRTKYWL